MTNVQYYTINAINKIKLFNKFLYCKIYYKHFYFDILKNIIYI